MGRLSLRCLVDIQKEMSYEIVMKIVFYAMILGITKGASVDRELKRAKD